MPIETQKSGTEKKQLTEAEFKQEISASLDVLKNKIISGTDKQKEKSLTSVKNFLDTYMGFAKINNENRSKLEQFKKDLSEKKTETEKTITEIKDYLTKIELTDSDKSKMEEMNTTLKTQQSEIDKIENDVIKNTNQTPTQQPEKNSTPKPETAIQKFLSKAGNQIDTALAAIGLGGLGLGATFKSWFSEEEEVKDEGKIGEQDKKKESGGGWWKRLLTAGAGIGGVLTYKQLTAKTPEIKADDKDKTNDNANEKSKTVIQPQPEKIPATNISSTDITTKTIDTKVNFSPEGKNHKEIIDTFINKAINYLGKPYIWGGQTTEKYKGTDCSGLIIDVLREMGILKDKFDSNAANLKPYVDMRKNPSDVQKGDWIFYQSHVMIAMGPAQNGTFPIIEAGGGPQKDKHGKPIRGSGHGKVQVRELATTFPGLQVGNPNFTKVMQEHGKGKITN